MSKRKPDSEESEKEPPGHPFFPFEGSHIVHELKTPLSEIRNLAELAQASEDAFEKKRYLDLILNSSSGLLDLVNYLLEDPKSEASVLRLVPVDIMGFVRGILEPLTILADLKDLRLGWEFEGQTFPLILVDPVRLAQVLRNLVSNALKYTERGEIRVHVSLRVDELGCLKLGFLVKDTGIGIAPENWKEIFTPFHRLPWLEDLSHRPEGSGLGLSLVKRLVDLMKGRLDLESIPGEGSVFRVELPVDLAAAGSDERPAGEDSPGKGSRPGGGGRRAKILLVEDNSINLIYMSYFLKSRGGYSVTIARNGKEAVSILAALRFDLVLMDLDMPVMDGVAATTAIRSGTVSRYARSVPVIALTAHLSPKDRGRLSTAGFTDIALKPVGMDRLIGQIERALRGARPREGEPDAPPREVESRNDVTFDSEEFTENYRGADKIRGQVLSVFFVEAPARTASLKQAFAAGKTEEVRKAAHSLANICGTVCAKRGTMLAREVESACAAGNREKIGLLVEALSAEVKGAAEEIERFDLKNGIRG